MKMYVDIVFLIYVSLYGFISTGKYNLILRNNRKDCKYEYIYPKEINNALISIKILTI